MAERDNVGAALLLLFASFHIGLTPILKLVRVDHKDPVRRTDEKRAPFRMLLYILWEVKCQVYSF